MKLDLQILQGKTFVQVVRWETAPIVYKPISAITNGAPVQITAGGHGLPEGWRAAVVSSGVTQLDAAHSPLWDADYHQVTYVDADNVQFNDVNSSDYDTYSSGGYLQYNTPQDLTGYTARMTIKSRVGGTAIDTFTTVDGDIVIDTSGKTITLTISATATAAYDFRAAVYDMEMVSGAGVVTQLLYGKVTLTQEVTT